MVTPAAGLGRFAARFFFAVLRAEGGRAAVRRFAAFRAEVFLADFRAILFAIARSSHS
jgi:hypothetical protein